MNVIMVTIVIILNYRYSIISSEQHTIWVKMQIVIVLTFKLSLKMFPCHLPTFSAKITIIVTYSYPYKTIEDKCDI